MIVIVMLIVTVGRGIHLSGMMLQSRKLIKITTTATRGGTQRFMARNQAATTSSIASSSNHPTHNDIRQAIPYTVPHWCQQYFHHPPKHGRLVLANIPTPLYRIQFYDEEYYHQYQDEYHGITNNDANENQVFLSATTITSTSATTTATSKKSAVGITCSNLSIGSILKQLNSTLYIKRDDWTGGNELGGNKLRKLEFLFADALHCKATDIITIGGQQSNHCRTTACVARMLGLHPHLILRTQSKKNDIGKNPSTVAATVGNGDKNTNDIGLVGNLLFDRMVGSTIYTCTPGEYGRIGSTALLQRLGNYIQKRQQQQQYQSNYNQQIPSPPAPYIIPVGGSNGLGTWGYINAVDELLPQWENLMLSTSSNDSSNGGTSLDHVVVACGSGGTTAGIALGIALAYRTKQSDDKAPPTVHAIGVCDDEDYFYRQIAIIADEMGFVVPDPSANGIKEGRNISSKTSTEEYVRQHLVVHQGKGRGYAQSTKEELDCIIQFARDTGIVLDPVYTGKALYKFFQYVQTNAQQYSNQNILFWHTGGGLGLYDKCEDIIDSMHVNARCYRLDVYGRGDGIDISE